MQKGKRVLGWMVLAVANMVQEKMGSGMTDDGREREQKEAVKMIRNLQ
jgi:hypothetical protein